MNWPEPEPSSRPDTMVLEMGDGSWEIVGFPDTMFGAAGSNETDAPALPDTMVGAVTPEPGFPMDWWEPEPSGWLGTMFCAAAVELN